MLNNLKKIKWFFKERASHYLVGVGSLQLTNFIVVIPPIIIGKAVDSISQGTIQTDALLKFVFFMCVLFSSEYILGYIWSYNVFFNSILADFKLRNLMMKKILKMPKTFFEKFSSGDLMARATSDIDSVSELLGYGILAISDGIGYLSTIVIAMGITISWKLTFFSVLPLPFLILFTSYIGKHIHNFYMIQQDAASAMNDEVLEHVNGIRVVRSYVLEKQSVERFEKTTTEVFKKTLKTEILSASFWPVTKIFTTLSYAIAIGYGMILISNGEITVGQLISFNVYLSYLVWPMFAIGDFINLAQRGDTSIERIYEVLDTKDELKVENETAIDDINEIKFENYSFKYPMSKNINLENITIDIPKGKTIGIVGRTGSGKSTIIKQLLKEYIVGDGNLSINNINIKYIDKISLMDKIGYVSQDNILFSKSIKENILLGKQNATDEEIMQSIKLADLERDINAFSQNIDTLVGERGVSLSGGQKQRISIARALIKNPQILLLDDALSAVDSRTQSKIIENIQQNRKDKTNIIVTHRLSSISHSDEIIVMDDGKIVERGTHEELMKIGGWYNTQYNIQQMEDEKDE